MDLDKFVEFVELQKNDSFMSGFERGMIVAHAGWLTALEDGRFEEWTREARDALARHQEQTV